MSEKNKAIGVFDSGVGGLTVFREMMKQMPNERLIFFGDTARVPYGSKSKETVTQYSRQIIRFLKSQSVKAIVVACNTASALALDEMEKEIDIPIIGVVKPGAVSAAKKTKNGNIGLIGTEATISSGIYERILHEMNEDYRIIGKACPLFVPLAEEGLIDDPVTTEIAGRYLADLTDSDIDTLIMGCTHYPLIKDTIKKVLDEKVELVNPAYETALQCSQMLKDNGIMNDREIELGETPYRFFVSDDAEKFKTIANMILPYGILGAKRIAIEDY